MYVVWDQNNGYGATFYLGFKLYKKLQGFYVGNSHLTGIMLFLELHGKGYFCPYNIFLWLFITILKFRREV